MCELAGDVPPVTAQRVGLFLLQDMHLGFRKIGKPTRMVGIQVREDDVPHIVDAKAKFFNAANGGVVFVELKARRIDKWLPQSLDRILHIQKADAGIDESQLPSIFEQKAMADNGGIIRDDQRPAVDMVNCRHGSTGV